MPGSKIGTHCCLLNRDMGYAHKVVTMATIEMTNSPSCLKLQTNMTPAFTIIYSIPGSKIGNHCCSLSREMGYVILTHRIVAIATTDDQFSQSLEIENKDSVNARVKNWHPSLEK